MDPACWLQGHLFGSPVSGVLPEFEYETTPEEVAEALALAYPKELSWPQCSFLASEEEEARGGAAGTSLTYGELFRDGLTKLLGPCGIDVEASGAQSLADLGSGLGRAALQVFLQFPSLELVLGVELVASRHAAAAAAAKRLAEAFPLRFAFASSECVALLSEGSRCCELRCDCATKVRGEELRSFGALLLNMPLNTARLCLHLAEHCREGCLLTSHEDFHAHWRKLPPGSPPCPFQKLSTFPEGSFAHMASPVGLRSFGFCCKRGRPVCVESFQSTPEAVASLLGLCYEGRERWQEEGSLLDPTDEEAAHAAAAGTSLTYGEVRPGGFTKLVGPSGLDLVGRGSATLLELGSGRGQLALQAFLQLPTLQHVVAVELVRSRHEVAVAAARRLAAALPERLRLEVASAEEVVLLDAERRCELRLGNFLQLPVEVVAEADAILLEVVLRRGEEAAAERSQVLGKLALQCKGGCVVASYEDLHSLWQAMPQGAPACPFQRLELCGTGFCTSWSAEGHTFHGFLCDREK